MKLSHDLHSRQLFLSIDIDTLKKMINLGHDAAILMNLDWLYTD